MRKTFKLEKEFAEKWLTALRDGSYQQGSGTLVSIDDDNDTDNPKFINCQYCCLGVAMALCDFEPRELYGFELPDDVTTMKNVEARNGLPPELAYEEKTRLRKNGRAADLITILSQLNDGIRYSHYLGYLIVFPDLIFKKISDKEDGVVMYTFKDIAEWVEDNVELV